MSGGDGGGCGCSDGGVVVMVVVLELYVKSNVRFTHNRTLSEAMPWPVLYMYTLVF